MSELGYSYEVVKPNELQGRDFEPFLGVIISGGPTLLTQVDSQKYIAPFKFVRSGRTPVLGVCLGHQIMGLLHGAEIRTGELISKQEQVEIVKQDDLFSGVENNSLFKEGHSESITLPNEFDLLAKSETCANEAMKHRSKKLYGTQFHPEVSGDNGRQLLKNFLDICSSG